MPRVVPVWGVWHGSVVERWDSIAAAVREFFRRGTNPMGLHAVIPADGGDVVWVRQGGEPIMRVWFDAPHSGEPPAEVWRVSSGRRGAHHRRVVREKHKKGESDT